MFRQMLFVQWRWARLELIVYGLLGFVGPVLLLRVAMANEDGSSIGVLLQIVAATGYFFILLAFVCAITFAVRPWLADQALKHVYALSLPLPWAKFVRYRFLAGAALLTLPALAVWLGGAIATAAAAIPPTLHAYPGGIAVRFLLSALVFYAVTFLLQYLAGKNAVRVATITLGALLMVGVVLRLLGYEGVMMAAWNAVIHWPGPFETLTARWMLIDV
jgi:hypothetical protein